MAVRVVSGQLIPVVTLARNWARTIIIYSMVSSTASPPVPTANTQTPPPSSAYSAVPTVQPVHPPIPTAIPADSPQSDSTSTSPATNASPTALKGNGEILRITPVLTVPMRVLPASAPPQKTAPSAEITHPQYTTSGSAPPSVILPVPVVSSFQPPSPMSASPAVLFV